MTYKITVEDLLQDLQLAKEIAIKNENANQLVTAVMAQARLLGIESGNGIATSEPQSISVIVEAVDARKYDSVE